MRSRLSDIAFPRALIVVCLAALVLTPATRGQDDARAAERALRRTPVVDVFEASRDAVVSISSTEMVTVRGRSAVEDRDDVRVIEAGGELDLALEPALPAR